LGGDRRLCGPKDLLDYKKKVGRGKVEGGLSEERPIAKTKKATKGGPFTINRGRWLG